MNMMHLQNSINGITIKYYIKTVKLYNKLISILMVISTFACTLLIYVNII